MQVYRSLKLWFSIWVDHHSSNNERLSKIGQNNRARLIISKCVKQFTYLCRHMFGSVIVRKPDINDDLVSMQLLKKDTFSNCKYFYHLINGFLWKTTLNWYLCWQVDNLLLLKQSSHGLQCWVILKLLLAIIALVMECDYCNIA